jgi:sugar lactone lactonase YvrE
VGPDNNVYVATIGCRCIQVFAANGVFLDEIGAPFNQEDNFYAEISFPIDVAVDAYDGRIYVADYYGRMIYAFTYNGFFLYEIDFRDIGEPSGIAVPSGFPPPKEVYVTTASGAIHKFNVTSYIGTWSGFSSPQGMEVGADGTIYVAETGNDGIQLIYANGGGGTWNGMSNREGEFVSPQAIKTAPDGSFYVADTGNNRVQKYSGSGSYLTAWGSSGEELGEFNSPSGIAVGADDSVYVADSGNNRIQQFDAAGTFRTAWGATGTGEKEFDNPSDIAVGTDGSVYVVDNGNKRIQHFGADGTFVNMWTGAETDAGEFGRLGRIGVAPDGSLYVTDETNHKIHHFNTDGDLLGSWGTQGTGKGDLWYPAGITVAEEGTVFVTNCSMDLGTCSDGYPGYETSHKVQHFTSTGIFIGSWGERGNNQGEFRAARDVDISPDGKIYVADTGNHRIQQFYKATSGLIPYKAIVFAGGGPSDPELNYNNNIWDATELLTNKAYHALSTQGLRESEIKYLHPRFSVYNADPNGLFGVMQDSTKVNLQSAITEWAPDADHVYIYLADHGGIVDDTATFRLNATEVLSGDELASWVRNLETSIPGKVTVIVEACHSGAFINDLTEAPTTCSADPIPLNEPLLDDTQSFCSTDSIILGGNVEIPSGANISLDAPLVRMSPETLVHAGATLQIGQPSDQPNTNATELPHVITSASADQPAYIGHQGLFTFSYFFWSQIMDGTDIKVAYERARDAMASHQEAQIETDGDGVVTNNDIKNLEPYCLGNCTTYASDAPVITEASVTSLGGTSATLSMRVSTLDSLVSAWAMILPPDYEHPDSSVPITSLPEVAFNLSSDCAYQSGAYVCSKTYSDLDIAGENYEVTFYALNDDYKPALPVQRSYTP